MPPVIDLSDQQPPAALPPAAADTKELPRRAIAYTLVGMLGVAVAVNLVALFMPGTVPVDRAKDMISLVLTPLIGLVGSVVGFYFGARTVEKATGT